MPRSSRVSRPTARCSTVAPPAVVLRFSEPVTPIAIGAARPLRRARGAAAPTWTARVGACRAAARAAERPVPRQLSSHLARFASGGRRAGVLGRERGAAGGAQLRSTRPAPARPARAASRVVHDLAVLVAAGGALFVVLVAPFPRQRAMLTVAAALAGASAITAVGLHGAALFDSTPPRPGVLARRPGDHPRPGRDRRVCRGCDDRRQRIRPREAGRLAARPRRVGRDREFRPLGTSGGRSSPGRSPRP